MKHKNVRNILSSFHEHAKITLKLPLNLKRNLEKENTSFMLNCEFLPLFHLIFMVYRAGFLGALVVQNNSGGCKRSIFFCKFLVLKRNDTLFRLERYDPLWTETDALVATSCKSLTSFPD